MSRTASSMSLQNNPRLWFFASALLLLTACGFTPLYKKEAVTEPMAAFLAAIDVSSAQNRVDQQIRIALEDRLQGEGAEKFYTLNFTHTEQPIPIGIESDGTISRWNLFVETSYTLTRKADHKELDKGLVRVITSYNVITADFATYMAERDALKRAATESAEEIRSRLITAFYRQTPHETRP